MFTPLVYLKFLQGRLNWGILVMILTWLQGWISVETTRGHGIPQYWAGLSPASSSFLYFNCNFNILFKKILVRESNQLPKTIINIDQPLDYWLLIDFLRNCLIYITYNFGTPTNLLKIHHCMVDLPKWVRSPFSMRRWLGVENMLKRRWCRCFRLHLLVCQRL